MCRVRESLAAALAALTALSMFAMTTPAMKEWTTSHGTVVVTTVPAPPCQSERNEKKPHERA
jgi:hypothetical protein